MTPEEIRNIKQYPLSSYGQVIDFIGEIRRLDGVINEYQEVIDLHHADFQKIKRVAQRGLQAPTALNCAAQVEWMRNAFYEIDRIVR